ncbi:O-antigen ligase family protein [Clostridium estertheticum]|uniref:O-antigen ligase family protein n=1 Tax=Clostridium estertheticum TaxID=238834 RepID=UPI0013EE9E21|nr:O-antigen ligase family protein [Clostridium estertheticum]MBZ9609370.1 O-antigen ligase family protein [Clostridium estertheticum]
MSFFLSFNKRFWVIELVCLLIVGTIVLFPMGPVSIALSEIIAIGFFLYLFIYRGLYKRNYIFPVLSKKVFRILFGFGIYFIILFGARTILHLPFKDTIWPIRSLILGSSIFFLIDEYKPKVNQLLSGIIVLYSALNIRELIDCFRFSDIRKLKFLDNINIYMYICIMFISFTVWAIKESKEKRLPSWIAPIAYTNMGISMVFAFLSGGRSGWVMMGGVLTVSFLLVFGFKWCSLKKVILFTMACIVVTIIATSLNFMKSKSNVYRSFSVIVTRIPGLAQPKPEDAEEDSVATTEASDKIRGIFWAKAWTSIKKNPVLGAGTFAVAYKEIPTKTQVQTPTAEQPPIKEKTSTEKIEPKKELTPMQEQIANANKAPRPAHNFILETWMGWGLVGLILYLAGLFSACFYVVIKLKNIPMQFRICCVLPIVSAAFISLIQSFILLNFQATYIMWFCLGIASVADHHYKESKTGNI